MTEKEAPRIAKWPFLLGDMLLLALAVWIVQSSPPPLEMWPLLSVVACVGSGAWLAVTPYLIQFQANLKFAESKSLTTAVEQINNVRNLVNQISFATAQWQVVQEHAGRTVEESRGIAEKMTSEAKQFAEFMAKANDREKVHLRLETEKLRRGQEDWLQVLVALMDHVYALFRAGQNSGQPRLVEQLGNYQMASRDIIRRLGLIPLEPAPEETFDSQKHQLADPDGEVAEGAKITEVLATGFSFQGQIIRRALVHVESSTVAAPEADPTLPVGNS